MPFAFVNGQLVTTGGAPGPTAVSPSASGGINAPTGSGSGAAPAPTAPKAPAVGPQTAPYATSTPGFGAGGVSPQYGTQSPTFLGTGTYTAPLFPINDQAITGAPAQGAAQNYGLNDVWSNLNTELQNAPNQGAGMVRASTGGPASYQAATGDAAQVQAAQSGYATSQAAQAAAASAEAAQGGYATGQAAQGGYATSQAAQGGYAQAGGVGLGVGGNSIAQQQALANTLNTQANGGGVSAADLQLKAGSDAGIAQQLAVLGSQRGATNAALAQRNAADQGAAAHAVLNQQMGIQRAQETQAAQQAEGAVLAAQGSQAAGINATQAGLTQQTQLANAANAQQSTLANTQNVQQAALTNAANAQAAQLQNAGFSQQTGLANEANAQQSTLQNTQNIQQANEANAALSQQAALANAGFTQQTSLSNAANAQQAGIQNAELAQQAGLANQGATNAMTSGNLAAINAASLGNAQLSQQTTLANLGYTNAASLANQNTELANSTLYDNEINAVLGAQAGIGQANKAASLADQQLQLQQMIAANQVNEQGFASSAQANANLTGAVVSGVAGLGAAGLNSLASSGGSAGAGAGDDITTFVPSAADTGTLGPNSPYYASSDENLKTGIEGGNPMMQSFLKNYRAAAGGSDATKVDVGEGSSFRNPTYGRTGAGGSAGGGGTGSSIGGLLGGIAGAVGGSFLLPGIGTAIGGSLGAKGGSAIGGAIGNGVDPATGATGGMAQMSPGSGVTVDESGWGQLPPAATGAALSDENEKGAITSGNRGMQAFLSQANAQTSAQNNSGSQSNAFMQTGTPPTAQADTQMPHAGFGTVSAPPAPPTVAGTTGPNPQQPFLQDPGAQNSGMPQLQGGPRGVGINYGGSSGGGFSDAGSPTGGTSGGGGITNYGGYQGASMDPSSAIGGGQIPQQTLVASPFAAGQTPPMLAAATNGTVQDGNPFLSVAPALTAPSMGSQVTSAGGLSYDPNGPFTQSGNGIGTVGRAVALSDEDEKDKATDPESVQRMLDQLQAYSYRYKDPKAPGAMPGQRLGVMAQDLERSPLGKAFVDENEKGQKFVNYGQMMGSQWAGLAMLNDRLDQHEDMLKSMSRDKR